MSLEKNLERIAEALEVIAGMKNTQLPFEEKKATEPQNPAQLPGQQNAQGNWQGQWPAQAPQQSMSQGGQAPTSVPTGAGIPRQENVNNTVIPGTPPPQKLGYPYGPLQGIQSPPPAGAGPAPTTATAQQYTFDQLAVATANLASSGKDVFPILGKFGIGMLMDLPPERFGEFAAALREAGAVI